MTFAARARQGWNSGRWTTASLVVALLLTTGCLRSSVRSRAFGLPESAPAQQKVPKATSGSPAAVRKGALRPDEWLREVFQQQTRGAFDPFTDDRLVQALQTRLRLAPQDVPARLELAGIFERYRLYEEALEQYTQAWNHVSQPPGSAAGSQLAEKAAVGLGRSARAAGRASEAVPVLAAFLERSPSAGIWNELGMLYDEAGNRAAAERAFRQALTFDPDSDRWHNNAGYNFLLQNKLEAAEAEFRRALELHPKSATVRNNLGAVLARRGDSKGALEQFRLAGADAATAHNNLAVVLLEMGDYERSRDELVQALFARRYFAPAMQNFKRVQGLLRQRAEQALILGNLPLNTVRIPPAPGLALSAVAPPVEPGSPPP